MTSHPNSLSKARRREALSGYLFLLPSFLGFAIFVIFPILYGIYLSFTNGKGLLDLHPLIFKTVQQQLNPNTENCQGMARYIQDRG